MSLYQIAVFANGSVSQANTLRATIDLAGRLVVDQPQHRFRELDYVSFEFYTATTEEATAIDPELLLHILLVGYLCEIASELSW